MASRAEEKRRARAQRAQREADQRSREQRTKRIWQLGAAVVVAAAVVIVAIVVGTAGKSKVTPPSIFNGIPQHGNVLGNPNARVTMTEFADLQCPFCREYTAKVMPTLVRRYVRTGKVKMAFQDIAFLGDDSVTAGRAAAAAGLQNRLWQFVDVAYADQGDENSGYVTDGWIKDVAGKVPGLDVNRLMSDRNAASTSAAIQQAQSEGRRLGVTTTPTFFLQRGTGPMKRIEFSDFTPGAFTGSIDSALAG